MRYLVIFFCYIKSEITRLKPETPSQIHLSYHDVKTRSISWVTFQKSPVRLNQSVKIVNIIFFQAILIFERTKCWKIQTQSRIPEQ